MSVDKYSVCRLLLMLAMLCGMTAFQLRGDDAEASAAFQKALEELNKQDYIDAAEYFAEAEQLADSVDLKFRAAMREADSYRSAGYRSKEFDALEKIIRRYPTRVGISELVDREYAIGDAYFHGYRDPAFWSLRFIPWLTDRNRMAEVYEAALKHAPFAPAGANARLRLAVHYLEKGENEKALKLLREVIRCYPGTETARFAMLELGNALSQMALSGDGDGKHFDEAMSVFRTFRSQYPGVSENEWVTQCENNARSAYAKRLYNIAEFYHREGRNDPAEVYLLEVMRRFPDTNAAVASEKLLTRLDKTYYPEQVRPEIPQEYPEYEILQFPRETRKLILAPENSDGKFLLPIYDLNLNKEKK